MPPEKSSVRAEIVTDGALWDRFVNASPYGELFHMWDQIHIAEKYSRFRLFPYGFFQGNELVCVLPLYFMKRYGLRMVQSPPPRLKMLYQGFVMGQDYDRLGEQDRLCQLEDVVGAISKVVKKLRPNYTSIIAPPGFSDIRPFTWAGYSNKVTYEYCMDMRTPIEELWNNVSKDCRYNIKTMKDKGLEIRDGGNVEEVINIMMNIIEPDHRPSFPPQIIPYVNEMWEKYPDNLKVFFLYDGDEVLGSSIDIGFKDKYLFWIGGAKKGYSEFFNWETLMRARNGGYRWLRNLDADTRRLTLFKSKFNFGLETELNVYKQDAIVQMALWSYSYLRRLSIV
jgi:hypothetical protein